MEQKFNLVKTETYQIPKDKQKKEIVFTGTQNECLGKFHRLSSFSFSNHKEYSYTHFDIEPCTT